VATFFYWYWSFRHFDIVMHIAGGFWVFIFLSSFVFGGNVGTLQSKFHSVVWIILFGVACVAVGWELIEWFFDAVIYRQNIWQPNIFDSLKDIGSGFIGAGLGYAYIRSRFFKKI
jgi:hypothetical protein